VRPFPIEELVDRVGSRFTVVVAAAKRAKQIKDGAPPLVNLPTRNALTIALHEIAAGLIEIGEAPEIPEEGVEQAEELAELAAPDALVGQTAARGAKAEEAGDDSDVEEAAGDDLAEDDDSEEEEEAEDEEEEGAEEEEE
jgi:DNA-directed RNA polymerase subunit omega